MGRKRRRGLVVESQPMTEDWEKGWLMTRACAVVTTRSHLSCVLVSRSSIVIVPHEGRGTVSISTKLAAQRLAPMPTTVNFSGPRHTN